MLLDLAQFQNVQQNAQMGFTGQHMVGNLNTGVKSQTQFNDSPDGSYTQVRNTNNMGQMGISGNHQFENFTNNGQAQVMARKYLPNGQPVLMELEDITLEDLAQFQQIQQNADMNFAGTHAIKNINTGAKSNTNFLDNKQGQFVTVANATNGGKMGISGNHKFENFTNNGVANVTPRQFLVDLEGQEQEYELEELDEQYDDQEELEELDEQYDEQYDLEDLNEEQDYDLEDLNEEQDYDLEDLAQFANYSNAQGGNTSIQGTHAVQNMNNARGGNVQVQDHRGGQYATFGNTNNAGNMNVSGLHQFDNTQNSGQMNVAPRQYQLMDLVTFNNLANQKGGNLTIEGTHAIKNLKNDKGGKMMLNDNKQGQFTTIANMDNKGKATMSGKHMIQNATTSGDMAVIPRKFKDPPKKDILLMDLATFNNFANQKGGVANFEGTHAIKNLTNAKKGQVNFKDNKNGQFVTVANTNNMGQMQVAGLHQFDNTQNSGQYMVAPRTFDQKGNPVKQLLLI